MDFALGFLAKDEVLAKDITNFYELESVSHELALGSYVELQSGSQDMVKNISTTFSLYMMSTHHSGSFPQSISVPLYDEYP